MLAFSLGKSTSSSLEPDSSSANYFSSPSEPELIGSSSIGSYGLVF